nr:tetratricopeptide repeat protein [Pelistega europaea]
MFLEARAYTAKGDFNQALDIYRQMTYRYPELAEPWNNMAILQARAGSLDEALSSLQMALSIRPDYTIANQNIAHIYSLLAQRSLNKSGVSQKK